MMTQNCDESNTKENEQIMMIPLEVDYDDNKKEGFLDEYNKDDGSSFPLHITSSSSPSSSYNKNRTTRTTMTKCLHFRIRIVMATIFIIAIFSAVLLFGTRRTPILRFRIGNEKQSSSSSSSSSSFFSSYSSSDDMNMNMNRTFKIMQITDIHLGEAEYTDWGPEQDRKTMKLLNQMFEYEKPDLIVLGGDQITANNCLGNCTEYYQILGRFLSNYGIPWATIMGNHDDMAYEVEDGTGDIIPHPNTLRRDLIKIDKKFPLSLSLSSQNSSSPDNNNLTGVTNYVLDVLDPITDKIALQIFFLDSGGGSMYEAIEDDQVQWLRQQAAATTATVPAVAFQHIPTSAHEYIDADTCLGYQGEGVAELQYDGGIVDAMIESGRFHFLAVGHNHGNDVSI
ncbi:MAG: putative MPP superfamily phosphohydrolase [Bacillariaceae sp.]|jgi:predicted MPP superfamily phosphohydrolase